MVYHDDHAISSGIWRRKGLPAQPGRDGRMRRMAGCLSFFRPGRLFASAAVALLLLMHGSLLRAQGAEGPQDGPLLHDSDTSRVHLLGNDAIIRMSKAGLDDKILIQTIQTQPGHYDTNPDDLIALKNAGVSQPVIAAMQARSAGLSVHAADEPGPTPLAPGIDEIGVYYKDKDRQWVPLKTERVETKSGGWLKSTLTHDIVSKDLNGHLDGPKSPLNLRGGVQILIYAPPGTQAEEYELIRFREHSTSREFRVMTGGVFHSRSGSDRDEIEFDPKKIGPQMYVFTMPEDIEAGQYGVLPPTSTKLNQTGKIFTFAIGR